MPDSSAVLVTRVIHAAPAEVCRGFTHETLLRDWLCNRASVEPVQGGYLFLHWRNGRTVTGKYEQIRLPDGLRFSWTDSDMPVATIVEVKCEAEGDRTRLSLKHAGRDDVALPGEVAQSLQAFWEDALENLAHVLETGVDLRLARRPRLGILIGDFTPEAAEKLNVPVKEGVLLGGTSESSGARAAGLEKGDVLISLNGVPLANPNSFEPALSGLKAGDRPIVEYYRGAEKHSTPLELGSYPIPELPADPAAMATRIEELNARVINEIRAQLAGLSEAQASKRPAEGEWSVKEIIAHLILAERDYQSWVADMLNDTPVEDWLLRRSEVRARVDALTACLGSLEALLAELTLAKEETGRMIAAFPDRFLRDRKHLYRRAAQWQLEQMPDHYFVEHQEQIQAAVDAGKSVV